MPLKCQYCACTESKVIDSRPTDDDNAIRRRRECTRCGRRFTTYEKIELIPLMVIKRDGRREPFDTNKIRSGILIACEKLAVSTKQIEEITQRVERESYRTSDNEITTQAIGDMVMKELRSLNEVAYVRFAAVYRKFTDASSFMQELQKLVGDHTTSRG